MKKLPATKLRNGDGIRVKKTGEIGKVVRVEISSQVVMVFVVVKTQSQDLLLGLTHLEVERC